MILLTVCTDVLQIIATSLHSRRFLSGEVDRPQEMFGVHSTYRPVHSLSYVRAGAHSRDGALAERLAPWLRRLKAEDVSILRPLLTPCSFHSQADGTVAWGLISDGDKGFELWQPTWKARVLGRDDDSPFKVVYTGARYSRWSVPPPSSVADSTVRLGEQLQRLCELVDTTNERTLRVATKQCFEAHHTYRLEVPGLPDILPEGLEPAVAALAASAVRTFRLLTSPAWTSTSPNPVLADPIVSAVWTETMSCFESAASAPMVELRKSA